MYFAIQENTIQSDDKFVYFCELCYWLMSMSGKEKGCVQLLPKENRTKQTLDSIAKTLLDELRNWGMKLEAKITDIREGVGDIVC